MTLDDLLHGNEEQAWGDNIRGSVRFNSAPSGAVLARQRHGLVVIQLPVLAAHNHRDSLRDTRIHFPEEERLLVRELH